MRWLLDEMLPPAAAAALNELGHDAVSVLDIGLAGAEDADVFEYAVDQDRIVITENFADYATLVEVRMSRDQPCVPVVFVRKTDLPARGALSGHLARRLNNWAKACPEPYVGLHWP